VSLRKAAAEKGIPVQVRSGSPGQLQIFKDGAKLFDYREAGQLPTTGELMSLITS
jgi:hypothetical protein